MAELLDNAEFEYLRRGGNCCPRCGTSDIEASGDFDDDGAGEGWETIRCPHCGLTWTDHWKLTGITIDEEFLNPDGTLKEDYLGPDTV